MSGPCACLRAAEVNNGTIHHVRTEAFRRRFSKARAQLRVLESRPRRQPLASCGRKDEDERAGLRGCAHAQLLRHRACGRPLGQFSCPDRRRRAHGDRLGEPAFRASCQQDRPEGGGRRPLLWSRPRRGACRLH